MQTLHVFIDTSIFRGKSFDLFNDSLEKLAELGNEKEVFIHSTYITINECIKNLTEMIDEHKTKIDKLNIHLRNVEEQEIDISQMKASRLENWQSFLVDSKTHIISLDGLSVESIFKCYFHAAPPFGRKDKKREFPDAFVLAALEHWCRTENEKMYVVSADQPFLDYCTGIHLIPLNSLEEFLDLYFKHEEKKYPLAVASFGYLRELIAEEVTSSFEGRYFFASDLWDSDVSDTHVNNVVLHQPYFINFESEFCHIEVEADIDFSVSLTYDNPNTIYRDPDTKDLVSVERIHEFATSSVTVTVSLDITFSPSRSAQDSTVSYLHLPSEIRTTIFSEKMHDHYDIQSSE